ncbi:MAG: MFS family permease [Myxococcota bacterium]
MTYAWRMVALTFSTQFLSMGFTFYSFSAFVDPLVQEFDASVTGVTMLPFAMSIAGAVFSPFLGFWIAKGSIRNIMSLGCIAMGVGFLLAARATELWQLVILFGSFITFGTGTMGGITTQALIVNWFKEERAVPLGVSLMGISASGMLMIHVSTSIVATSGWRVAFEYFGIAAFCALPLVFFAVVGRPEEHTQGDAQETDGEVTRAAAELPPSVSTRKALRQRNLWVIAAVSGLSFMGTSAVMIHAVKYGIEQGLAANQAAWIISSLAGGAMGGKLVFGWLATKLGEQNALFVALIIQGAGIASLATPIPFNLLVVVSIVLGLGLGGVMPLASALMASAFGPAAFGPMMGLMTPMMIPFQSVGAPMTAAIYDSTGSYTYAWLTFVGVAFVACAILSQLKIDPDNLPDLSAEAMEEIEVAG